MKTKAVRLYGAKDLRLEEFELPKIKENEILAKVVTDSICMSSWKLANQGEKHKKTPNDLINNPIIIGHEFCGDIIEVGKELQNKFNVGDKYVLQANLQLEDAPWCPGYSYQYTGGDATYIIIHPDVIKQDCLIKYNGSSYFEGSLVEPLSCVVGAFNANYHLKPGTYEHIMGIKNQGNLLILGGTGPMGLIMIDYALHGPIKPKKIIVTDISEEKLTRAAELYSSTKETQLFFENVGNVNSTYEYLYDKYQHKFDDIFVMVPAAKVVEDAVKLMGVDSCLNFFAGPQDKMFEAKLNFYDVHYNFTHIVGTSGGNVDDVKQAVKMIEEKKVDLSKVVTHVLGLNDVPYATLNQPEIGGGKKLIYTGKEFSLSSLEAILKSDLPLKNILEKSKGLWSKEAEDYVLKNYKDI
ncbi:L-sorbose 1-phosphate reductase [Spiroplasma helicoides]|uniref:L-sorbose 1-phosphate reductase n=1 Tax=Spiroplasma helicoides TaxID=216938 RepID=A0A1B3SLQ7_9MOLU|nr:zinc-binding dehydrogenase [Spiroplasma helicoides]AOG60876.1 L-sorbose 1-phosphate reductase [Spiroplasma helicoides]